MNRALAVLPSIVVVSSVLVFAALPRSIQAQGIVLDGAGPINRSMGGAATAAPIDSAGALLWNPASIGGLQSSELAIGFEFLLPSENLSSSIAAGALGGGTPPIILSGSTTGEPGVTPIPSMSWVHKCADSPWTVGLGVFAVAGFSANYPASLTNPVLFPQNNQPGGFGGLGHVATDSQYYQIVPTASYALTEKLSLGFAPTLTLNRLTATPLVFAAPDDGDGNGVPRYPVDASSRYSWGGGFQLGLYYVTDSAWQFGFSFKSPQWFEPIRFNVSNEVGAPRYESVHFDYPMILSFGTAYTGFERWLLACDVRYFDYHSAAGYGDPAAYSATGAVTGLGWQSIASVHLGAQYQATERLYLRMGYAFNDNPIASDNVFFNVGSPLIIQHLLSTGLSYNATDNVVLSLAYIHGFENTASGPFQMPGVGALAGTSVTSKVSADAVSAGVTVRY